MTGSMFQDGHGVPIDNTKAIKWYRKAAAQGDAVAEFNLGWMYTNGLGVAKSYSEAMNWFRKSASQGNLRAREGMQHINGVGYVDGLSGDTSFRAMERHPTAVDTIRDWLTSTEYDAVIWTALASNFAELPPKERDLRWFACFVGKQQQWILQ